MITISFPSESEENQVRVQSHRPKGGGSLSFADGPVVDRVTEIIRDGLFEALKKTDEGTILWHYSRPKGTINILTSREFWATHYRDFEDPDEISCGWRIFQEAVSEWASHEGVAGPVAQEMSSWENPFSVYLEAYVMCFCANEMNDELWHNYAERGTGSALGVTYNEMRQAADYGMAPWDVIVRVVYDSDEQLRLAHDILRPAFEYLATEAPRLYPIGRPANHRHIARGMWNRLMPLVLAMKNPNYYRECEWRRVWIFDPKINDQLHNVRPFTSADRKKRLPIPLGRSHGVVFNRIKHGPHSQTDYRAGAFKSLNNMQTSLEINRGK